MAKSKRTPQGGKTSGKGPGPGKPKDPSIRSFIEKRKKRGDKKVVESGPGIGQTKDERKKEKGTDKRTATAKKGRK